MDILTVVFLIIGSVIGSLGIAFAALYFYAKKAEKDLKKVLDLQEVAEGDIYGILKIDNSVEDGLMLDLSAVESKGIIGITTLISAEELERDIETHEDFIRMSAEFENMDDLTEMEKEAAIESIKETIIAQISIPTFLGHGIVRMNEEGSLWDYQIF